MNKSRALVSGWTSITDNEFRSDHLKLCFLWYDEVIIETIGKHDEKKFIDKLLRNESNQRALSHALSDVIPPLDKQLQEHVNGDLLTQAGRGYPRWGDNYEKYTYPKPESADQFAHNHLLGLIAQEHGVTTFKDSYDIQQAEGRARLAVDAVTLWAGVNSEIPCMLQANKDEKAAMTAAKQFLSGSNSIDAPFSLFEVAIPSLRDVAWKDIVQFRQNGSLNSLRNKIAYSIERAGDDLTAAKSLFDQSEREAVDAIVDYSRPRVKRVIIESILGNLPGINPLGLLFNVRDTATAFTRNRENGWLYLLRDIRGVVENGQRHTNAQG